MTFTEKQLTDAQDIAQAGAFLQSRAHILEVLELEHKLAKKSFMFWLLPGLAFAIAALKRYSENMEISERRIYGDLAFARAQEELDLVRGKKRE